MFGGRFVLFLDCLCAAERDEIGTAPLRYALEVSIHEIDALLI